MKHQIIILMTFFSSIFGVMAQQSEAHKILAVGAFKDSITNKNVQLVDVRTPEEYKDGHIEDAKNIDFYSDQFATDFNKLNKDQPLYIYCRSGKRSGKAAEKLSEMGFKEIYDLKGGYLDYKE